MFTFTEEQRKQLLQYMWQRPYGEVAQHIAMLASLKPTEKKDDRPKKRSVLIVMAMGLSRLRNLQTLLMIL